MFRTRRRGVQEGNAIDTVVAFEMKLKHGTITTDDQAKYEDACRLLGVRGVTTSPADQAPQRDVQEGDTPAISALINPPGLEGYWGAIKVIGTVFLLFAMCTLMLLGLVAVMHDFVSLAHP